MNQQVVQPVRSQVEAHGFQRQPPITPCQLQLLQAEQPVGGLQRMRPVAAAGADAVIAIASARDPPQSGTNVPPLGSA